MFIIVLVVVRFDYWEVRPNELLHHHGFLADMERLAAPNLRMEKEINDVFEYLSLAVRPADHPDRPTTAGPSCWTTCRSFAARKRR